MTAAEIARKYAHARTGYELASYREVALPLFRVECTMLVLEHKPLPPIQEYVLRAVDAGVTDLPTLAGLLGLDEPVARTAAAELLHTDNLVLAGAGAGPEHHLRVTRKGHDAAAAAAHVQAVELSLPVWVDGLTRDVVSVTGRGLSRFPASEAQRRGLVEIAPSPRRRPELPELPFERIRQVIERESAGRRRQREVIGIVGLGKARRFAREGVALAYRAQNERDPFISLVVDGELSEVHDAAFEVARKRSARPLVPSDWTSARDALGNALSPDLLEQAAPPEETDRLQAEREDALQEGRQLRDKAETAPPDELAALRQQLEETQARETELRNALDNISVRQVPVYEHRDYLERALTGASDRVLIISPWIRFEVVDTAFITRLRKLLDRDVELWIGYGINPEGGYRAGKKGEGDREAENSLKRLAEQYPGFRLARLGDTHAKVLICDSRFSIITSFNWLSFRGDTQLQFRDERGYYVGLQEKVDEVFDSYRSRFEDSTD